MSRPNPLPHLSLIALVGLVACKAQEKPDAFVKASIDAAKGQPRALWDALPPSYHKDVHGVVAAFAAKVPAQQYDDAFVLAGKVAKILETKKSFVLGHPMLQGAPIKPADLEKGWDPAVRALSTLVTSDIKSVEGLKKLDVGAFAAGPLASIIKDLVATVDAAGGAIPGDGADQFAKLKADLDAVEVKVEKVDGDKATIKVKSKDKPEETIEMAKIEEKWLPKDLVSAWPVGIASAKAQISTLETTPEMLTQFDMMKGMITPVLDGLLAATTQEEFNAKIEAAMKLAGGPPREERVAEAEAPSEEPAKPSRKKKNKR